jgi:transcriptional regulator with XRE-family HTH domain
MSDAEDLNEPQLTQLGGRLRALRSAKGWTLEELAERSGFSKAFLSRLEAGSRQPSIAAVLTLARVFDVPMGDLFGQRKPAESSVVVRKDAAILRRGDGISYVPLSSASQFSNLQPIRLFVSASRQGDERYQHDGEEWVFVVSGSLRLALGDRQYELNAGDSAHFDSRIPHRLTALHNQDAEAIVVACPIPVALGSRRETSELTAGLVR